MNDPTSYTPNQIDKMLAQAKGKCLAWIQSGELKAHNLAKDGNGQRPRWRVFLTDLETFLESRASKPPKPVKPTRRRRKSKSVRHWV